MKHLRVCSEMRNVTSRGITGMPLLFLMPYLTTVIRLKSEQQGNVIREKCLAGKTWHYF
jgi:hypothetical protein